MRESQKDEIAGVITRYLINVQHYSTAQAVDIGWALTDLIDAEHECESAGTDEQPT